MTVPRFVTFWQGPLSGFEAACLASFVVRGYAITVFSYEPIPNLPAGVAAGDASAVAPASARARFLFDGRPNLQHFSDYFRYRLLSREPGAIWVDADITLLRPIDAELPETLFGREHQAVVANAVLRFRANDPRLARLMAASERAMTHDLTWGATGMELLFDEFDRLALLEEAMPAHRFFPLDHDAIWKVLLPAHYDECCELTAESWSLHLFNNVLSRLALWKRFAPPEGSFLHRAWERDGSLQFFDDVYPARIMEQMVENWRLRQSGDALGIRQVAAQIVPSVGRTLTHYLGNERSLRSGLTRLRTRFSPA